MIRMIAVMVAVGLPFACRADESVLFPKGPAAWTVQCVSRASAASSAATPAGEKDGEGENPGPRVVLKKVEVVQDTEVRRSITHWSNGKRREIWGVAGMGILLTEDPTGRTFATGDSATFGDPFSPSSFSWIKPEFLQEEKPIKFAGKVCHHYKGWMERPDPSRSDDPIRMECEAWIEVETLRPAALRMDDLLGVFTFGAAPGKLNMPAKFRKRLDYYKVVMGME